MRACSFSMLTSRQQRRPQSIEVLIGRRDQQESEGPGEPRRLEAGPSIGHQCRKPRINRHPRQDALPLNEHLSRQLRQAWITLSAERQIIQHLPETLLQSGLAGKEGHGWAARRPPPPAGAGQGPAPSSDAERSAANVNNGRLVSPLTRSPIMRRAGAASHQELVADLTGSAGPLGPSGSRPASGLIGEKGGRSPQGRRRLRAPGSQFGGPAPAGD